MDTSGRNELEQEAVLLSLQVIYPRLENRISFLQ